MSGFGWQSMVVILAVGGAVAFLIRALFRRRKAAAHCANCPAIKAAHRH